MARRKPKDDDQPKQHTRSKTLHYKRARLIGQTGGLTLAQYLDAALSMGRPMDRMEKIEPEAPPERPGEATTPDKLRVVNACTKLGTMIVGAFLDYTLGGATLVLSLDPNADELVIEELPPPDKKQHVGGILYFGVRDNHVILLQASGLRSGHFENHLNWLLKSHTRVLDEGCRLFIEDEPKTSLATKLNVDWIELHAPISVASFKETEGEPKGPIRRIIRALQEDVPLAGTLYERLNQADALKVQDVEMTLRISRKGRGKKRSGPSLVDEFAHTFRHVDDVRFTLETRDGATITNSDLKLAQRYDIRCKAGGGKLELDSVAEAMQQWLSQLIAQRHVGARKVDA